MEGTATAIEWSRRQFRAALKRAAEGVIDARGVRLSSDQLRRLLDEAPKDPQHPDRRLLREVDFRGTILWGYAVFGGVTFSGDAAFRQTTFSGSVDFGGAAFSGDADFREAAFSGDADFRGAAFSGDADFREAAFSGIAVFSETTFRRDARFSEAAFGSLAVFSEATFSRAAEFGGTNFSGDAAFIMATFWLAIFGGATFSGDARFIGATLSGIADFDGATFSGGAAFPEATFSGGAAFGEATFTDDADFDRATFTDDAYFLGATFRGDAAFREATFGGVADFGAARFEQATEFGPALIFGEFALDGVVFARPVKIEVSARRASLARAVFRAGADVFVRWAEVSLEDADFAEASLVAELPTSTSPRAWLSPRTGAPRTTGTGGESSFLGREEPAADGGWVCRLDTPPVGFAPRVVSARRAKLARLTSSRLDLRACRFAGAHDLDKLRVERSLFAQSPSGWQMGWRRLRWTRRQTVAEEQHWRTQHGHGPGWYEAEVRAPAWLAQASQVPEPEQIAGIYRDLRKGREDNKDEPGAADFYYGEMEMRRQAAPRLSVERFVLSLYWLVAGYGLRASRALVALAITIALGAVLLGLSGFDAGKHPDEGTLLFAAESSISLLRPPDTTNLTAVGHVVQIALRLAGPLFFGLALLSLRGRVKR